MTPLCSRLGGAFWLGVLTSVSPCPLATNLAAISYVGRNVGSPGKVFLAGVLYTLGRVLVYVALAALLVASVLSSPGVSLWLQANLNKFLGPLLILVGMTLLGLLSLGLSGSGISERLQQRVDRLGLAGAGLLGLVFALSFCPVSAAACTSAACCRWRCGPNRRCWSRPSTGWARGCRCWRSPRCWRWAPTGSGRPSTGCRRPSGGPARGRAW